MPRFCKKCEFFLRVPVELKSPHGKKWEKAELRKKKYPHVTEIGSRYWLRLDLPIDIKSEIQGSLYSLRTLPRDFQPTVPDFLVAAETELHSFE
jgi:hypothetical protein